MELDFVSNFLNLCVKNRLFKCVEMAFAIFFGHQVLQLRQRQNLAASTRNDFFFPDLEHKYQEFGFQNKLQRN